MQVKLDDMYVRRIVWPDKRDDPYCEVARLEAENALLRERERQLRDALQAACANVTSVCG